MKVIKACSICVVAATALCAVYSFGQGPKAVLNAKQLGIEDLNLDLGLDEDLTKDKAVATNPAPATVEAPKVDAPAPEVTEAPAVVAPATAEAPKVVEPVKAAESLEPVVEAAPAPAAVVEAPAAEAAPVAVTEVPVVEAAPAPAAVIEAPAAEAAPVATVAEVPAVEAAPAAVVEAPAAEAVVAVAPAVASDEVGVSELSTLEEARRSLFDQHGRDCLAQGNAALLMGNWSKAIEKFKETLKFLVENDTTLPARKDAEKGLGEAYYRLSLEQQVNGNLTEAEKSARESHHFGHPKAEKLLADIQNLRANPPPPPPPKHELRWNQPEYKVQEADIHDRMKIAKEFYATEEFAKSREQVELILRDYPWCEDAVNLLRKVSIAEHKYVDNERVTAREEMIKDVTKAWASRTYGKDYSKGKINVSNGPSDPKDGNTSTEMKILQKMKDITIPEIDFRQANITDVVTFLSEASREFDRQDIPVEERGINIVLNLGGTAGPSTATATPAADGAASAFEEATPASTESTGDVPPLSINSRYLTLLNALDMIMDLAGLKYRIRDNVVMIMKEDAPEGKLIHRMYNVLPSIVERIPQLPAADAAGGGDAFGTKLQAGTSTETTDWKKFFGDLGVPWPDGSTVQHMPSIGKLVVLNTEKNLATLESVLAVLNVTPKQVEIEVRFVEVMQSDLDSLGLEWTLNDDWEIADMKADASLPAAARRRISMKSGSINSGFNYLNNNTAEAINNGAAVADNLATFTSILTNPELSVVLHMLSNRQNTDLLSAPKVVSQAGSKATIKVVTEYIYPTEYDVEMLESSSGNNDNGNNATTYSGAVVEPQSFQMREVGVILEVTPEVTPDGSMINLTLAPSVVSEPTWKNYGSTYPVSTATGTDLLGNQTYQTEYVQLPMEQPFFPVRSVATSVQIYNGATVVMGGMITEARYTNEDKIPFLGDIPLLGQLFRYKYEQSEKRNLLLFVTARLVDPAGREVKDITTDNLSMMKPATGEK